MASSKVAAILRSKGAPFSDTEIDQMPDHMAWRWIYGDDKALREAKDGARLAEVCFTGFGPFDRERLAALAKRCGLTIKDSVTKKLVLLVTGPNAGPSKLEKARLQGCVITDEEGFLAYVRSKGDEAQNV
jgi:NAD-dependent DNA ligase